MANGRKIDSRRESFTVLTDITEFKVGDRVRILDPGPSHNLALRRGQIGRVWTVPTKDEPALGVVFAKKFALGHSLDGTAPRDRGRYLYPEDVLAGRVARVGTTRRTRRGRRA